MNTEHHVPIQDTAETRPIKRHHTARYYVHRVQDSLTTRVSKFICTIFLSLLLFIGVITFILWLSLRPHRPRFHTHDFSIPGLAQGSGFGDAQVIFNVTARNSNHNIGIYYDAMQVTLLYEDQNIGGTTLLFPFFQEPKNTTVLFGKFNGATLNVSSDQWMKFMANRAKGMVIFRLDVMSAIRFKISRWISHRHKMHANCEVGVGPDGLILASYREKRCPVYFT